VPQPAPSRPRSPRLGRLRLVLLYAVLTALVVASRPTPALLAAGALLAFLGEALRIWAAGHLVKSVRLVTSGPYARTRNPLYLGRLLIMTGLLVAARIDPLVNLAALAIGYGLFFLYYLPRKERVEGSRLAARHGEAYEAYRRDVPALALSLRRYPGAGVRWSSGLLLRSQEPLVIAGLLLVFAILARKCSSR